MKHGNLSLGEIEEMDYALAGEIARRLLEMHKADVERDYKFHTEIAKAVIRSNGARIG
jgi:hypothetical protein